MKKDKNDLRTKACDSGKASRACKNCKTQLVGAHAACLLEGFKEVMGLYNAEAQSYFFYFSAVNRSLTV